MAKTEKTELLQGTLDLIVLKLLRAENNRRARYYELTAAGRKQLSEERAAWQRFSAALGLILRTD